MTLLTVSYRPYFLIGCAIPRLVLQAVNSQNQFSGLDDHQPCLIATFQLPRHFPSWIRFEVNIHNLVSQIPVVCFHSRDLLSHFQELEAFKCDSVDDSEIQLTSVFVLHPKVQRVEYKLSPY